MEGTDTVGYMTMSFPHQKHSTANGGLQRVIKQKTGKEAKWNQ